MPYYSELGIYTSPSSSLSGIYVPGPYANHSSIIASNFLPSRPIGLKAIPSRNFRGYKPHLATISETQSHLRRLESPKIHIRRPVVINTADIDVSVNKYRKYERAKEDGTRNKSPSPTISPKESLKDAKPNKIIRRDRATIRLKTIHKDLIPSGRSWRDNFEPHELNTGTSEERREIRKTPGQLLKEKFLIRSREDIFKSPKRLSKKNKNNQVLKTPSFRDICNAITTEQIDEPLNPGQPIEIQRRQSRQYSSEEIFDELQRRSSDMTQDIAPLDDSGYDSKKSVRKKKKVSRKKSVDLPVETMDCISKSNLQRRPTQKRRNSGEKIQIDADTLQAYQNSIRDISQVEIEEIPKKPKPIITGTVDVEEKLSLKAVVDDVEITESPKKKNKFRFNVTVEEIVEKPKPKPEKTEKGVFHLPKPREPVVSKLPRRQHFAQLGHILEDIQELTREEILQKIEEKKRIVQDLKKKKEEETTNEATQTKRSSVKVNLLQKTASNNQIGSKTEEGAKKSASQVFTASEFKRTSMKEKQELENKENIQEKREEIKIEASVPDENMSDQVKIEEREDCKNVKIDIEEKAITTAVKKTKPEDKKKEKTDPKPAEEPKKRSSVKITLKNQPEEAKTEEANLCDGIEKRQSARESKKYIPSKRSLVFKRETREDPDLEVFVPPEPPEPSEPEPEQSNDVFVPLQSNRLSQFMHPFKKPEQFDECPVEIFATPKVIRKRHYPRPRHPPVVQQQPQKPEEEEEEEEEEQEDEEEETSSEEEEAEESSSSSSEGESDDEYDVNVVYKVGAGASTSSNDSGFDSGLASGSRNKDCDVNCHKKCEKLTANLCGVNQKLVVEAIESARKGSTENRDSPTSNPAHENPAFDPSENLEEYSQSSTYVSFQRSGRITPPATTIPRFRKYGVDDFNFLKVLGKGSFGKVLLAELKNTEYYYAIKCLKKDVVMEDDDVECTLIERKVLALGTKHPYLCHLLCTFQTDSHLFFVMEYLNGGDLMFHIQQSGRFPEHRARFYGAEIVSGLKFLHNKGIVYRDLKLDNILLDFDGHVRIADFGMCKLQIFLDRMAETFCGTPDYMAPEIIKGLHYNQCVDWWSFGILLYEMLLGQSPFSGCDEDELFWSICNEKPVIPQFLTSEASAILLLLLEKDANKRLGNRLCPAGDIQEQPFFKPICWEKLEARQLEAPFKPNLQHPLDTQYFDKTFTVEKAKLTPIDQNILQSMDQRQFQGFSYTNPNATEN